MKPEDQKSGQTGQENETGFVAGDRKSALSALLDDEISELELRRLLQDLEARPELLEDWERYSLTRSVLQGEPFRLASGSFSEQVAETVAREPLHGNAAGTAATRDDAESGHTVASWAPSIAKLAVAASVTLAVFLGMQLSFDGDGQGAPAVAGGGPEQRESGNMAASVDPEAQQRLNEYIQSVSIPAQADNQLPNYNILRDMPEIRPVSNRELVNPEPEPEGDDP